MDRIIAYRLRRNRRLERRGIRMDADDEGRWVTTENGHHVHFTEGGKIDKGNPHVVSKMNGGGSKQERTYNAYRTLSRLSRVGGLGSDEANTAIGDVIESSCGEGYEDRRKQMIDDFARDADFSGMSASERRKEAKAIGDEARAKWSKQVKGEIASTLGVDSLPQSIDKAIDDFINENDDYGIRDEEIVNAHQSMFGDDTFNGDPYENEEQYPHDRSIRGRR